MNENADGSCLITGKNGEPLGSIDKSSICNKISEGAAPETEIFRWMISPPVTINETAGINEAIGLISSSKSDMHLYHIRREKDNRGS